MYCYEHPAFVGVICTRMPEELFFDRGGRHFREGEKGGEDGLLFRMREFSVA